MAELAQQRLERSTLLGWEGGQGSAGGELEQWVAVAHQLRTDEVQFTINEMLFRGDGEWITSRF
ncbi:hypothetical protein L2Y94_05470 [Luteibacter aegosomatis]|uniref:hypothetical protein n=1 Tax=Luteibacter aegosomatis TaxID=2911537 RepID=UPI001FFB972F|nr:hypothetical protein [Luteibacter aegosomatis]UPG86804.1 hypothetical protein L2Y94_05470 [Luteibacter aegosomatis]